MRYLCKLAPLSGAVGVLVILITYYIWFLSYYGQNRSRKKRQRITEIATALAASVFVVLLSLFISYIDVYRDDGLHGVYRTFFGIKYYKSILLAFVSATVGIFFLRLVSTGKRKLPLSEAFVITGRQRMLGATVIICWLTATFFIWTGEKSNYYTIRINEVCSDNRTIVLDEGTGLICDYVELYNWGNNTVNLDGLYLSDDKNSLLDMQLDACKLEPGGMTIVLLDDNADFSISRHGETLYLSDGNENIISMVEVPASSADAAYSYDSRTDSWNFCTATPGVSNDVAEIVDDRVVSAPVLSAASGFYDKDFELTIEAEEGTTIYYTLDCRRADENSLVYTEPVLITRVCDEPNRWHSIKGLILWDGNDWSENVDKCVVVRAIAVSDDGRASDETIATYFVGMNEYKDRTVISLVPDYDDFFSDEGIYTVGADALNPNFFMTGEESEREAYFEYFGEDGAYYSQNLGIRIFGHTSRNQLEKRFNLYARKKYSDSNIVDYTFFGEGKKYKKLALRNGFSNMLSQEIMKDTRVLTVDSMPVTMFLDGELYGDTYLQVKLSADFIAKKYNVNKDNIILLKNNSVETGNEDEIKLYSDILKDLFKNDYSGPEAYKKLCDKIDIESYIEFTCANLYLANMDYQQEGHNFAIWRTRESENSQYGDCRWRFIMYDMDSLDYIYVMLKLWGVQSVSEVNSFTAHLFGSEEYSFQNSIIYSALKENKEFMQHFLEIYSDMLNFEFSKEHIEDVLDDYGETLDWNYGFFKDRNKYVLEHIAEEFKLSGDTVTINVTVAEPEGGCIRVNTRRTDAGTEKWSGEYPVEVPVSIEAIPESGYEFVGWTGDLSSCSAVVPDGDTGSSEVIAVIPDKEVIELHAIFRKTE